MTSGLLAAAARAEGPQPGGRVLRAHVLRHLALLQLEPRSHVDAEATIDEQLDRATRRAALFRQVARERERRCFDRARRHHTVDQAPVARLARIQPAAQQHQLLRAPRTDQAWQALTAAAA